jgi:hypothetical protein
MRPFVLGQAPTSIIPAIIRPLPAAWSIKDTAAAFVVKDGPSEALSFRYGVHLKKTPQNKERWL